MELLWNIRLFGSKGETKIKAKIWNLDSRSGILHWWCIGFALQANGYPQSKWLAEMMVFEARSRGWITARCSIMKNKIWNLNFERVFVFIVKFLDGTSGFWIESSCFEGEIAPELRTSKSFRAFFFRKRRTPIFAKPGELSQTAPLVSCMLRGKRWCLELQRWLRNTNSAQQARSQNRAHY